jgi:ribonuclease HII
VRVGIDENGLGPRLGPLIVTAVTARAEGEGHWLAHHKPRGAITKRLGDSKALVSFGNTTLGEAWARAVAGRLGLPAETPDRLVHALCLDPREELRRPCPNDHASQCWSTDGEAFVADEALVRLVAGDLDKLAARGLSVLGARLCIVCTERLNNAAGRCVSRFVSDLHAMERLALAARDAAGEELRITCGKVGGYDRYAEAFGPLAGRLYTTVREGRARSEYRIAGLGSIAFVRDADAGHTLVCIASLIGKWARDLLMARITRYHRAHDPSLPEASGYHDPVTRRFIEASALARRARGLQDACFERVRVTGEPALLEEA